MKIFVSVIVLTVLSISANAYEGMPKEQVDSFFKDISMDTSKAIDNLYASNPGMKQKVQALTAMKSQMPTITTLYGKYLSYEIISIEEFTPSLVRIRAIEKHELHAISWEFYFYKPLNIWMISQATFGDLFQYIGSKH